MFFGSSFGRETVRRAKNAELNLRSTIKYGGRSMMVWGCMAANGMGNLIFIAGILGKAKYLKISKGNSGGSVDKLNLSENYYFQRDNDGYYTLPHPPQRPNLNATKRLWDEADGR